ncbi:T9SS type A sorting domain-containing protein [Winogradskyella sp.]|uniref:T9SS type A sorting domain-containing protein n=1 Tax=Winogradskyella sp. TaxID=1883156 RepID=UPI002616E13C|nr:T9SS type A sorting domain-containing protein [Winogradskyella sp.]
MKFKLFFFVCLLMQSIGFAQCPSFSGNLMFNNQQEIDDYFINYPGCTELQNVIVVEGTDITNVNGFNGIINFGGLWVVNNPLLTDLDGFNSLTNFDFGSESSHIYIENNPLLTNLNGLANAVNDNPMDLTIKDNPQLISLDGLQGIQGVGYSIGIINNDLIVDFNGLNGFTNMDDFYIEDNDNLTSFVGLDNLGLTGSFVFINNDSMTSFDSLNNIVPLCGFEIRDNNLLEDIDGFTDSYQQGCGTNLIITGNPNLSTCSSNFVCDAIPFADTIEINNNSVGCNNQNEVELNCSICPDDNVVLTSQAEVDNFMNLYPNCDSISGFLVIVGSDIEDLSPLSSLNSVGSISVTNTSITSMQGLEALNITGLNGMDAFVVFDNNLMLQNILFLNNYTISIPVVFVIRDMDSLLSLEGAGNIIEYITIVLDNNDQLTDLNGLNENLSLVGGLVQPPVLQIIDNNTISDISRLDTSQWNSSLTLEFSDNPALAVCQNALVCDVVDNGNGTISNNAVGCNSNAEVIMACEDLSVMDIYNDNWIKIYPNPAFDIIYIKGIEDEDLERIVVYSYLGQKISETNSLKLNISEYRAGVYFIEILTNRGRLFKTIVKK